jgi:hypothetical protein
LQLASSEGERVRPDKISPKSYRGYSFMVEMYENGRFAVFRDPARGYVEVCRVELTDRERNDQARRDALFGKVVTAIAAEYRRQYQYRLFGLQMLSASQLSVEELSVGVGLTPLWKKKLLPKKLEPKTQPRGQGRRLSS